MLLLHDRSQQPGGEGGNPDALIREARRLRRRRWMRGLLLLIVAGAVTGLVVAAIDRSSRGPGAPGARAPSPTAKGGPFVTPNTPGSLAVGRNGDLYVIDFGRDQILRHLPDGRFQVVAGDGKHGFSGDGGDARLARLRLQYNSSLALASNGTVYFSDTGNKRVRAVLPDGTIETVAGGGTRPVGERSVSAHAALLASGPGSVSNEVTGLAIGPRRELYLGLPSGVYRLTASHVLVHVIGSQVSPKRLTAWNGNPGNAEDFLDVARVAFDRAGDLFVVGGGGEWGLYERTTTGALRFVHVLRGVVAGVGSGTGAIASDPDGQIITISNFGIQLANRAGRFRPVTDHQARFVARLNQVFQRASNSHEAQFRGGGGIAVAANGTIYVDADAGMFSPVGGILAIHPNGHITAVWLSRITKP